ncbi:hypothetical protein CLAIMM_12550, partial [Cladophialophora immunda]
HVEIESWMNSQRIACFWRVAVSDQPSPLRVEAESGTHGCWRVEESLWSLYVSTNDRCRNPWGWCFAVLPGGPNATTRSKPSQHCIKPQPVWKHFLHLTGAVRVENLSAWSHGAPTSHAEAKRAIEGSAPFSSKCSLSAG